MLGHSLNLQFFSKVPTGEHRGMFWVRPGRPTVTGLAQNIPPTYCPIIGPIPSEIQKFILNNVDATYVDT